MNDFWVGRIYGNGRISMHGKILDQVQVKSGRKNIIIMSLNEISTFMNVHE